MKTQKTQKRKQDNSERPVTRSEAKKRALNTAATAVDSNDSASNDTVQYLTAAAANSPVLAAFNLFTNRNNEFDVNNLEFNNPFVADSDNNEFDVNNVAFINPFVADSGNNEFDVNNLAVSDPSLEMELKTPSPNPKRG
jgi:hypothetical protein